MPRNRTLSLLCATFPYSGNSTGTSLTWPTAHWLINTMVRLRTEEKFKSRIHDVIVNSYADTPICMTRNLAVKDAQTLGCDLLLMIDSDMHPDVHLGEPGAVPFFDAAFDRIYELYDKGPRAVAAPYGGTPPHENMFLFRWREYGNLGDESPFSLEQYTREEALYMEGIHEAAALPTGLIMYDMRCFELYGPPYFDYEWTDDTHTKKASTEDVQATRDLSIAGCINLGYNPVECAWSSWSGHLKNWCVKKPGLLTAGSIAERFRKAMTREPLSNGKHVIVENLLGAKNAELIERMAHAERIESPSRVRGVAACGEVEGECCPHRAGENGSGSGNGKAAEAQEVKLVCSETYPRHACSHDTQKCVRPGCNFTGRSVGEPWVFEEYA